MFAVYGLQLRPELVEGAGAGGTINHKNARNPLSVAPKKKILLIKSDLRRRSIVALNALSVTL